MSDYIAGGFFIAVKCNIVAFSNLCSVIFYVIMISRSTHAAGNRVTGWLAFILHRMEVMLMKDDFDFKDLMSFGMFLLALLTFIYLICH